jgi:hypothetical protein
MANSRKSLPKPPKKKNVLKRQKRTYQNLEIIKKLSNFKKNDGLKITNKKD